MTDPDSASYEEIKKHGYQKLICEFQYTQNKHASLRVIPDLSEMVLPYFEADKFCIIRGNVVGNSKTHIRYITLMFY